MGLDTTTWVPVYRVMSKMTCVTCFIVTVLELVTKPERKRIGTKISACYSYAHKLVDCHCYVYPMQNKSEGPCFRFVAF